MTKKDYQAIARALYQTRPGGEVAIVDECEHALPQWEAVRAAVADVLAADNPRFDRDRFREACEAGRCKGMAR